MKIVRRRPDSAYVEQSLVLLSNTPSGGDEGAALQRWQAAVSARLAGRMMAEKGRDARSLIP